MGERNWLQPARPKVNETKNCNRVHETEGSRDRKSNRVYETEGLRDRKQNKVRKTENEKRFARQKLKMHRPVFIFGLADLFSFSVSWTFLHIQSCKPFHPFGLANPFTFLVLQTFSEFRSRGPFLILILVSPTFGLVNLRSCGMPPRNQSKPLHYVTK